MKASYALSVGVLATILAALAFRGSDGHAAEASAGTAGPPQRQVNLELVRTLDCQGAIVCRQEKLLFITGAGGVQVMDVRDPSKPVEAGCFTSGSLNAQQVAVLGSLLYVANKPPLGAVILRFQPPR